MNYPFDPAFTLDCFREVVAVPSPVGYYVRMNPVIEQMAERFGLSVTYDNKSTAYITLDGEDNSKTVMIGAHLDTIGMIVRQIDANGMIRVRQLGGINFHSAEGCTVTVLTRDGRSYTGLLTAQSHSVHVFDDAREQKRDEEHMMIILDEPVKSRDDVVKLGIRHGDMVHVDPQCEVTANGYLKSRFIDDKAAVACAFTAIKYLLEHHRKPRYRTIFAFPYSEEIGIGGTYIPEGVSEFVAIDIGLIGPDYEGEERRVSICCKDNATPYDYELTSRLISLAEQHGIPHAVDIFYRYGTDASAALRAGNNLKAGAFGMAVYCSHGRERTHVDGLNATTDLLLSYLLEN